MYSLDLRFPERIIAGFYAENQWQINRWPSLYCFVRMNESQQSLGDSRCERDGASLLRKFQFKYTNLLPVNYDCNIHEYDDGVAVCKSQGITKCLVEPTL